MESLSSFNLLIFLAFVVPGFLSMRVYGLVQPIEALSLKENALEAIAFGIVNFAVMFWAIAPLSNAQFVMESPWKAYGLIVLVFFIAPMLWPLGLHFALRYFARKRWILQRNRNSWDDWFMGKKQSWVIAHLKDGRRIGGWYGENSYASLYPNSGHLYIEELWNLDDLGRFKEKVPGSSGVILRPDDYHFIELFESSGGQNEQQAIPRT